VLESRDVIYQEIFDTVSLLFILSSKKCLISCSSSRSSVDSGSGSELITLTHGPLMPRCRAYERYRWRVDW
jgi:hypothetical protein